MNFRLGLVPLARKIVLITLRVMRFHHAERDEYNEDRLQVPGEMSRSSRGRIGPSRLISASPRLRVSASPSSEGGIGPGRLNRATFVGCCAAALLLVHAGLLAASIPRNAVTIDEVVHLPIGMSYWQRGEFWGYHHNPPFVRLLFALPAVLIDVPIDYSNFNYLPGNRGPESRLGCDFMLLNRNHYIASIRSAAWWSPRSRCWGAISSSAGRGSCSAGRGVGEPRCSGRSDPTFCECRIGDAGTSVPRSSVSSPRILSGSILPSRPRGLPCCPACC